MPVRLNSQTRRTLPVKHRGLPWRPHQDLYHFVLSRSWIRFFVLCFVGYLGIVALFAVLYNLDPNAIRNARPGSFEDAFNFSLETFATIGYGAMTPNTRYAHVLVMVEAFVGILGVALITGITFAKFARPTARVLFTDKLVVYERNGVPHLAMRMANVRGNTVLEAQLSVIVLVVDRTMEGEVMRRPVMLKLLRDRTPMLPLSWTAFHRIDEESPLFGDSLKAILADGAEIYLAFTGMDETTSQTIHARYSYKVADIVWGARFVDIVTVDPDGTRIVDYEHFHDTQLVETKP